jgi:hypothetical protein
MPELSTVTLLVPASRRGAFRVDGDLFFYKRDHPRPIDRYIDFFGDRTPAQEPVDGEIALGRLA